MTSNLKFGRLPAEPDRPALSLGPHLKVRYLENLPQSRDWLSRVSSWPMFANDEHSDCVFAAQGHGIQGWTAYATREHVLTTDEVLAAYSAVTGFDPRDPRTDQGTVMQDAMDYWRKVGIGGRQILVFARIDHRDLRERNAAINAFGSLQVGMTVTQSAMDQFDANKIWDVTIDRGATLGGHAIHVAAYTPDGATVTTWGRTQFMTNRFWQENVDEAWVCISRDFLDASGRNPLGVDLHGLGADFAQLTGGVNPFPPNVPEVGDPDAVLAQTASKWVATRHIGSNNRMSNALKKWLAAKHL